MLAGCVSFDKSLSSTEDSGLVIESVDYRDYKVPTRIYNPLGSSLEFTEYDSIRGDYHGLFSIGGKPAAFMSTTKIYRKEGLEVYKSKKSPIVFYDGYELGREYSFDVDYSPYLSDGTMSVGGKPTFLVKKGDELIVFHDGKEIRYEGEGLLKNFHSLFEIIDVDEKLAFRSDKGIYFDGKMIGQEFDNFANLIDVNGKLAFTAQENDKYFVYYDGQLLGEEYDNAMFPHIIGGKLVYLAEKGGKFYVIMDGQEVGGPYDKVQRTGSTEPVFFFDIGGSLAYSAERGDEIFIVYKGKELGKEFSGLSIPYNDAGSLAYIGHDYGTPNSRSKVIFESKETLILEPHSVIGHPVELENGIYLEIYDQTTDTTRLFYKGEWTKPYAKIDGWPSSVFELEGKLMYVAEDPEGKRFVVWGDKELGKEYDQVWGIHRIGDTFVYAVNEGEKVFLVYEGGEVGREYDTTVSNPFDIFDQLDVSDIGGKLGFIAQRDGKHFIVVEK